MTYPDLKPSPFHPLSELPELELSSSTYKLITEARASIAELNGYCLAIPNPFLVLSPVILKESIASSEVENIQTTLVDALQNSLYPEAERALPDREVLRYREAILWGHDEIKRGMPLVGRVIRGIQGNLIPGDGAFRTSQNAIWNPKTQEVLHVPPAPEHLSDFIRDWEEFVNGENQRDPLVNVAIAHHQFESIHPFSDGNGRTGRILMVLDLVSRDLLRLPILYLSGYITQNKAEYYRVLQGVRDDGLWEEYIQFMMKAFHEQSKKTADTFIRINDLFEQQKQEFESKLSRIYSRELLEELYLSPIVTPVSLSEKRGVHYTTSSKHLKQMEEIGLLTSKKVGKFQFYINHQLIDILM